MHRLYVLLFLIISRYTLRAQQQLEGSLHPGWMYSTTWYYYFIPGDKNTGTLIGYADHKKLHLEARYNYEDKHTGSAFAGWRFETNGTLSFRATPLLGMALGNTDALVPALELELRYKRLDYYSETEYVIDWAGRESDFFYLWGELAINPVETFRTGLSYQKTKLYHSGLDLQKGFFINYGFWKLTAGFYYFNPFSDHDFFMASLGIDL